MIDRVLRFTEDYLRDVGRDDVDPHRFICIDDSRGATRGCSLLIFGRTSRAPVLVAKGAPRDRAWLRDGRSVYEIEYDNLEALERHGMNRDRPTTPAPLCRRSGEWILTLQSALEGRLIKNVPGRELFAPSRMSATVDRVLSWWGHFQQSHGVQSRRVTEQVYRDEILLPVGRFRKRLSLDEDEHRFLIRRFEEERRLLDAELPFMAMHGDLCTANVVVGSDGAGVFDWEFPLRHHLPLFDLFYFFSSTRYPFRGRRGESTHFESFREVFWSDNPLNRLLRRSLRRACEHYRLAPEWLPDLFALSLIRIANLKFESLVEVHGIDEERPTEPLPSAWERFGEAGKDVPLVLIRDGACENLRFLVRNGFPRWLERSGVDDVPAASP